jgi:drug/metabolite transporter (DMT)-like permease
VLVLTMFMAVGGGVLAAPDWVPLSGSHLSLLLGLAVTGFLGQITITEAFRSGQASVVAPFEYTALAWGAGLDWLIWQTLPQAHTWIGAAIVIGSGLYLLLREKNAKPVSAPADHP